MVRSEKQERSDIVYIELDGESRESGAGGGRAVGPVGTERDGERKREQGGRGRQGWAGDAVGAGGCRSTARVECERERAGIAGGGGGGAGGSGFGATAMSVCTRTPSRPRRWR